jgi:hypothetical protein
MTQVDYPECPSCGAKTVPIAYGMPGPEMVDEYQRGEIELGGGCLVEFENPDCVCRGATHYYWREDEKGHLVAVLDS